MLDYYKILGIPRTAQDEDIRQAYKILALANHPKRYRPRAPLTPSEYAPQQQMREQAEALESLQTFHHVSEAFDVLSDPLFKAIFDSYGERALKEGIYGPDGFITPYAYHGDPELTFREFFKTDNPFADLVASSCAPIDFGVSQEIQGMKVKQAPTYRDLQITLEEAYTGCTKKVMISKKVATQHKTFERRQKVLTIKVPPGADNGMTFTFPSEGDQGGMKQPGDIVFVVRISPHDVYERNGNDLILHKSLNLCNALTGTGIDVHTLDDRHFKIRIVHIVDPGYEKILPGEGMPKLGEEGEKGDMIIKFSVKYPTKLGQGSKQNLINALCEKEAKQIERARAESLGKCKLDALRPEYNLC